MARIVGWVVGLIALAIGVSLVYVYQRVSSLEVAEVTPDVHVIYGLGGNVGVLRTDDGSVVVDTMTFTLQGREIRETARRVAGPVQAIVNTHYHLDHTHGNPAFAPGLRVVSTTRTRAYLDLLDADYWKGDAAGTLPNETFDGDEHVIHVGGKTLRLVHPGRGHTDGDLVVLFEEDHVLHTGDLFFNGTYPNIDLEAGGSVKQWVDTLDRVLALDFDKVIPGHGPVTDRAGLVAFQRFMRQLAEAGAVAARDGLSLEELQRTAEVDADEGYDVMAIPFVMRLDRDFALRRSWEEATGHFERVQLPEEER